MKEVVYSNDGVPYTRKVASKKQKTRIAKRSGKYPRRAKIEPIFKKRLRDGKSLGGRRL